MSESKSEREWNESSDGLGDEARLRYEEREEDSASEEEDRESLLDEDKDRRSGAEGGEERRRHGYGPPGVVSPSERQDHGQAQGSRRGLSQPVKGGSKSGEGTGGHRRRKEGWGGPRGGQGGAVRE